MTAALSHRGPDDSGYFVDPSGRVGLGHRRLSIIDLSPAGRQPMSNAAGSIWVTFNGEIYNYREIRRELAAAGEVLRTNTDTEVIVLAYERWGINCLDRLRGMFAFALWDGRQRRMFLVRDRVGVKPLYYHVDNVTKAVLFASELKSFAALPRFPRRIDPAALHLYFRYGYVPSPRAIFEDTFKVKPGHYLQISESGDRIETAYWSPVPADSGPKRDSPPDEEEALRRLRELAVESFEYRLVSDVPVGIFLSGGVDSSLIAGLLAKRVGPGLKAFTVAFEEGDPEAARAATIAQHFGMDHQALRCTESDALALIPSLPTIYDEPLSDPSSVPTTLLCRAASTLTKVALSGDGGDEFFCGYSTYPKLDTVWRTVAALPAPLRSTLARLTGIPWPDWATSALSAGVRRLLGSFDGSDVNDKLAKLSGALMARDFGEAYDAAAGVWHASEIPRLAPLLAQMHAPLMAPGALDGKSPVEQMMLTDALTLLPDALLVKVDRASMSCGLEVREPLLDHKLIEFAVSLPLELKLRRGTTKHLLKRLLRDLLPAELVDQPKRGFSPPLGRWLRGPLKSLLLEVLHDGRLERTGVVSQPFVRGAVDSFLAGKAHSPRKMWNLLMFGLWADKWQVH
jgi:asparagine synthase (glutamine-hydrolysing)